MLTVAWIGLLSMGDRCEQQQRERGAMEDLPPPPHRSLALRLSAWCSSLALLGRF